jgi:hypothetical protein
MPQPSAAVGHCTVGAMRRPRGRDASAHADGPFTNPHLHQDWAHPGQQLLWCAGTGLIPATSAPGPGSPRPHLRWDWEHAATSAPGPGADARVLCAELEHVVACEHGPRRRRPPGPALDASRKPPFIRTPSIAELASAAHFRASPLAGSPLAGSPELGPLAPRRTVLDQTAAAPVMQRSPPRGAHRVTAARHAGSSNVTVARARRAMPHLLPAPRRCAQRRERMRRSRPLCRSGWPSRRWLCHSCWRAPSPSRRSHRRSSAP